MKIGVFDSGLGGLLVTHGLIQRLPLYDYLYLGDTARVPYGNRSQEAVYDFTQEAIQYLFKKDCKLVIVACNTASAEALRRIQQEFLPAHYPGRKVLGVLVPAAEQAVQVSKTGRIGVIATQSTVASGAYAREIQKLRADAVVVQQAAPLLVPLIENNGLKWAPPIVEEYLTPVVEQQVDTIILGCTHYPYLKDVIIRRLGGTISLVTQDEIVPIKLEEYLKRHPRVEQALSRNKEHRFMVTDLTESLDVLAEQLFGEPIQMEKISLVS